MKKAKKPQPKANLLDDGKWFELKVKPHGEQVSKVNKLAAYLGDRLREILKIFERVYRPAVSFDIYQVGYAEDFINIYALRVTTQPEYVAAKDEIYEALFDLILSLFLVENIANLKNQVDCNFTVFSKKMADVGLTKEKDKFPLRYFAKAETIAHEIKKSSLKIEIKKLWESPACPECPAENNGGEPNQVPPEDGQKNGKGGGGQSLLDEALVQSTSTDENDENGRQLVLGHDGMKKDVCLEELKFEKSVYFDTKRREFGIRFKLNGLGALLQYKDGSQEKILAHLSKLLDGPITLVRDANADNMPCYHAIHDIVNKEDG